MSRRTGILLAFVGIVILIIGFLFLNTILRRSAVRPVAPTAPPPITAPVIVAARPVPVRGLLKSEDLKIVEVPIEFVPLDAVTDIAAAVGKISKIPLRSGEMLLQHHLADPTNINKDLAFIIGDDQVVVALPASDLLSQLNILQPGDLVDILVSIVEPVLPTGPGVSTEAEPQDILFTFDAQQHIEISAIVVEVVRRQTETTSSSSTRITQPNVTPTPAPTVAPESVRPIAILVALDPQDALVLKNLRDTGGVFDVVLRSPTSAQNFELDPVTSEYIKDRYELVPEP